MKKTPIILLFGLLLMIFAYPVADVVAQAAKKTVVKNTDKKKEEGAFFYDARSLIGDITDTHPVVRAIVDNDAAALREALPQWGDINKPTADGTPLIVLASVYGKSRILKALIAEKPDVAAKDRWGRNVMHYMAVMGDEDKFKFFALLDVPVDEVDADSLTPLYYAYYNRHMTIADFLVSVSKARVNRLDAKGYPLAFSLVSRVDDEKVVKHMIDNRLNLFKRNQQDENIVDIAVQQGHQASATLLQKAYEEALETYRKKLAEEGDLPSGLQPDNGTTDGATP